MQKKSIALTIIVIKLNRKQIDKHEKKAKIQIFCLFYESESTLGWIKKNEIFSGNIHLFSHLSLCIEIKKDKSKI